jgi:hypothetical protein
LARRPRDWCFQGWLHRERGLRILEGAMAFVVEEGEKEVRVNLKPWLWLVFAVGFIGGALVSAGLAQSFGWFC